MKVIELSHIYQLANKLNGYQTLTFFKDLPKSELGHDGVLCQELLRVLIDRMLGLWSQKPCDESTQIIQKLRECLILFEVRAAKGTLEKSYALCGKHVECLPVQDNGHIFSLEPNG